MLKYKITSYGTSQTFPLDLNEMKWQIIIFACINSLYFLFPGIEVPLLGWLLVAFYHSGNKPNDYKL